MNDDLKCKLGGCTNLYYTTINFGQKEIDVCKSCCDETWQRFRGHVNLGILPYIIYDKRKTTSI